MANVMDGQHHIMINLIPIALSWKDGTTKLRLGDKDSLVRHFGQEFADNSMKILRELVNWVATVAPEYEIRTLLHGSAAKCLVKAKVFNMEIVKSVTEFNHSTCAVNSRCIKFELVTKRQFADFLRPNSIIANWIVILCREMAHIRYTEQSCDNADKKAKQKQCCEEIVEVLESGSTKQLLKLKGLPTSICDHILGFVIKAREGYTKKVKATSKNKSSPLTRNQTNKGDTSGMDERPSKKKQRIA